MPAPVSRLGEPTAAATLRRPRLRAWAALLLALPPWVAAAPADMQQVERGAYLAQLSDCAACHTARDGRPMAGGLAMGTPFGVVYTTNITPDEHTGIGGYSFEQFERAVRRGVAADGHHLYPVMPYPSFAKITDEDMRALYAYFMHGVAPVFRGNRENDLRWPFGMRFGLMLWNLAFLDDRPFAPDDSRSAQWNRGAYLAQGPGHCGACHTPRGLGMQEKSAAQDGADGRHYLAGSTIDGWHAPSLRGLWSAEETARFLKTGRSAHGAAYGSMAEVVHFSTQGFSDEDLAALGTYLASLPPAAGEAKRADAAPARPAEKDLYGTRGGLGYVQFCSTCHRLDGRGVPDFFPALADNTSLQGADPSSMIHIALTGGMSAQTQRYPRAFAMPAYARLSDAELSEILSFVRAQWGAGAGPVDAARIAAMRTELGLKPEPGTPFAMPRFAALLDAPDAAQLVRGMRLMTETKALLPGFVGNELDCTSCHLDAGTVAKASPFVGVAALFPMYAPRAGRIIDFKDRINACFRRSMHGKPLPKDSADLDAMVAFMASMKSFAGPNGAIPGRGVGKFDDTLAPDARNGAAVYEKQCAVCHGAHGEGRRSAGGAYEFPALAGDASFNIGAGMARTRTAAGFVKNNMPLAAVLAFPLGQGGLSDQDALDVAEYFSHLPRPDFPDKKKDWPKGGKPKDARY